MVPPVTVDVKLCNTLIVPDAGPAMLAVRVNGDMVTSWKATAVFAL